jgi:class 3 adenylate cyclase
MDTKAVRACVLLADISGSTGLYEAVGDRLAQRVVGGELARLQRVMTAHGGVCIRQKGDDVLGYFTAPGPAFHAVRAMLARQADHALRIHAGLHYGQIVLADGDIFGEVVNLTARLAGLANAGEALLSRSLFDQLSGEQRARLQPLNRLRLRGIRTPIEVYAFVDDDPALQTQVFARPGDSGGHGGHGVAEVGIVLSHGRHTRRCAEAQSLVIGRADDCGIVLPRPWVSRRHAVVTVAGGKVLLEDCSSSVTYVAIDGSHELLLRRETIMLASQGVISPALRPTQPEADPIHFRIVQG